MISVSSSKTARLFYKTKSVVGFEIITVSGFTLIELVVVILIMGLMSTAGFLYLGSLQLAKVRTEVNKFGAMVRYVNNLSVMNNIDYRLNIDLDSNSYGAEPVKIDDSSCSPVKAIQTGEQVGTVANTEPEGNSKENTSSGKDNQENTGKEDESGHKIAKPVHKSLKSIFIKTRKLPSPVKFQEVKTQLSGNVSEHGKVSILFFPDGTIEKALIFMGTDDMTNTIEILPGMGTVKIYRERKDKDIKSND